MMWYKNFIKILIFDLYMLFVVFFRLMFCKAVSKEGCGILKKSYSKMKYVLCNQVSDQFHFIICLGNWELKL